ncbi:hypothetical protein PENTCL1PPCAC_16502, partial [Pristionchus entomophagus]
RMDAVTPSMALSSDIPEIHQFLLDDFLPSFSLAVALGITRNEAEQRYLKWTTNCVNSETSVLLRNTSGRIIGIRLCDIEERGSSHEGRGKLSEKLQTYYRFIDELDGDKWSYIPSTVDKLWLVEAIAVDKDYRGRGLGKMLMEFGVEKAIEKGVQGAASDVVANASIAMFAKYGYIPIKEIFHSEYLGQDGLPVFKCPGGEKVAQCVFKQF